MCGIAGIISWDGRQRIDEVVLAKMAGAIAHRGPDAERIWLNRDAPQPHRPQAGFAFRRLAVLDCDARAMQPMTSPDGRYTLLFNGEIYNYRELKKRLPGYAWQTTGDTEVLLAGLAAWGTDIALERCDGMFAIALWDEAEQTLTLARDRMGQKPLYYAAADGSIAFASELPALRHWPKWDRQTNSIALNHYLRYGYVHAPDTIFTGANHVEPGTRITFRTREYGQAYPHRWFNAVRSEPAELVERKPADTKAVIESAVRRQLVSDVPLGLFLSGGIDSSVVALAARKLGPVKSFSIAFDDARYDESNYAEAVAKHLGTQHETFRVTPDIAHTLIADLPKLAAVFGEPFADSSALPTHWLSQQTRRHVTVALSGDGGDELFGGYDRYRAIAAPAGALRPLAPLGKLLERGHPKAKATRVGRLLSSSALPLPRRYDQYVSLFDAALAEELLGRSAEDDRPTVNRGFVFTELLKQTGGPMEAALAFDRVTYLPGDLLTKVDRCSMLHGLEVRSPFMDVNVIAFASSLRKPQLMTGGPKRLLREAFAGDLPDFVFTRQKMGFAVPIGEWLRGPLRAMWRDFVFATNSFARQHFRMAVVERMAEEHETGKRDHGQRLYALLMLELWWRAATA